MGSLVLELQQQILTGNIPVTELLRKTLVICQKLDFKDFQKWVESEMNGYDQAADIPSYRKIKGVVKAKNAFRGWIPVSFGNNEIEDMISITPFGQGISHLESAVNLRTEDSTISIPLPNGANELLNEFSGSYETVFYTFFQYPQLVEVIEKVKTIILKWTLELEKANILGEGMSFNSQEKRQAESITHNNFSNYFGPVTNSQIQQGSTNSVQSFAAFNLDVKATQEYLDKLVSLMPQMKIGKDKENEIVAEVGSIKAQLKSPKPKSSIIQEGFHSLRTILEEIGGGVAAGLLVELAKLHLHIFGQ
ncbi:MAG TPA: hypothetical protein VK859_03735 [bacterium]|jgi:hypothetical protein|nr:hypothetical protein [bacterium]